MEADSSFQQRLVLIMNERTSCSTAVEIAKKLKVENQIYNATYFPYSKFASRTAFVIPGEGNTPCAEWVREAIILEDVYNDNVQDGDLRAFLKQYGMALAGAFELIHANRIVNASNLVNDPTLGPFLKQIIARADTVASNITSIRQKIDQFQTAAGSSSTSTVLASALPSSIGANPGVDPARVKLNTSGPLVYQKEWLSQDDPVWNDLKAVQKANAEKATKSQKDLQFMPVPDQPLMVQLRVMNANQQAEAVNSENQQTDWNQAVLAGLRTVADMTASRPDPKNSISLDEFDRDVLFPLRLQNAKQIPSYATQDPLERVTGVNASVWFQLFGYDPASAINTTGNLWDSDTFFKALKVIYTAMFGGEWCTALLMTAKDGIRASMWSCRFDYALKYVALIRQWAEDFGQLSHAINGQSADEFLQETMMLVASTSPATVHGKKQILDLFQLSGEGQKAAFHQQLRQWLEEACDYLRQNCGTLAKGGDVPTWIRSLEDWMVEGRAEPSSTASASWPSSFLDYSDADALSLVKPGQPLHAYLYNFAIWNYISEKLNYNKEEIIKFLRNLGYTEEEAQKAVSLYLVRERLLSCYKFEFDNFNRVVLGGCCTNNELLKNLNLLQNQSEVIGEVLEALRTSSQVEQTWKNLAKDMQSWVLTQKQNGKVVNISTFIDEIKTAHDADKLGVKFVSCLSKQMFFEFIRILDIPRKTGYFSFTADQLNQMGVLSMRAKASVLDNLYFDNYNLANSNLIFLRDCHSGKINITLMGYNTHLSFDGNFGNSCWGCASLAIKDAYRSGFRTYMWNSTPSGEQKDLDNRMSGGKFLAGNQSDCDGLLWVSPYFCCQPVRYVDKQKSLTITSFWRPFWPVTWFGYQPGHYWSLKIKESQLAVMGATSEQILNLLSNQPWPRNLDKELRTKNPLWIRWFMDSARTNPPQPTTQVP